MVSTARICPVVTATRFLYPATVIFLITSVSWGADFAGGMGTPEDPYQIATAEQLIAIGDDPNLLSKHFVLVADIDLDPNLPGRRVFERAVIDPNVRGECFNCFLRWRFPIVDPNVWVWDPNQLPRFEYYDPNKGLKSTLSVTIGEGPSRQETRSRGRGPLENPRSEPSYQNGFSGVFNGGGHIIRHLYIDSPNDVRVGLFRAIDFTGEVFNLGIKDASIHGRQDVGILVGENRGAISGCYTSGFVQGHKAVGGLIGDNTGEIVASYSSAFVKGELTVAGLVGDNTDGWIDMCYAAGRVQADHYVGGLVGYPGEGDGNVSLCFWDWESSEIEVSAGGTGMTTIEMKDPLIYRGWDYLGHWTLAPYEDYPRLGWESRRGQPMPGLSAYFLGQGEPNDPIVISTPEGFLQVGVFRSAYDKHIVLGKDIDLEGLDPNAYTPIGTDRVPFIGCFDGQGHTIYNLRLTGTGLFGTIGSHPFLARHSDGHIPEVSGWVKNLSIENALVSGSALVAKAVMKGGLISCHVGGKVLDTMCGLVYRNYGLITACSMNGEVEGSRSTGGLVGNNYGTLDSCMMHGRVKSHSDAGGLAAKNWGHIVACKVDATVTGPSDVGGLVGGNSGVLRTGYANGWVNGTGAYHSVGGLVGRNEGAIVTSYSAGEVVGKSSVGGLVGRGDGIALLSYWDVTSSGQSSSSQGEPRTTNQLMQSDTFEGWGGDGVWMIDDGNSTPHLSWEGRSGIVVKDRSDRYAGGSGTAEDPYRIRTAEQLRTISHYPGDMATCFLLERDIDLATIDPNSFQGIGWPAFPFVGHFDGGGHRVSNYRRVTPESEGVGLFRSVGERQYMWRDDVKRGGIRNLHILDVKVKGEANVGGLVGLLNSGNVRYSSVQGSIDGTRYVGGLVGCAWHGEIDDCHAHVDVNGWHSIGGLVGCSNYSSLRRSSSRGEITGQNTVGGLIGSVWSIEAQLGTIGMTMAGIFGDLEGLVGSVTECYTDAYMNGIEGVGGLFGSAMHARVSDCYSTGELHGSEAVGGLCGYRSNSCFLNCYSAAFIHDANKVGGLIGHNSVSILDEFQTDVLCGFTVESEYHEWEPHIRKSLVFHSDLTGCFWDTEASHVDVGLGAGPEEVGLVGLSTLEMQKTQTFLDAGWDFTHIWTLCEGRDYPRLKWEGFPCDGGTVRR